jgi:hypothetical protein
VLGANIVFAAIALEVPITVTVEEFPLLLFLYLAAASVVILFIGSIKYRDRLGKLGWVGLGICAAELAVFFMTIMIIGRR